MAKCQRSAAQSDGAHRRLGRKTPETRRARHKARWHKKDRAESTSAAICSYSAKVEPPATKREGRWRRTMRVPIRAATPSAALRRIPRVGAIRREQALRQASKQPGVK